jgi:hypothetical protein
VRWAAGPYFSCFAKTGNSLPATLKRSNPPARKSRFEPRKKFAEKF